jgi:hypothetical protein
LDLPANLQLLDWSSRMLRPGKVSLPDSVPDILSRLQIDANGWRETLERLLRGRKQIGSYFGSRTRINEVAAQRGTKYLKNVVGSQSPLIAPNAG